MLPEVRAVAGIRPTDDARLAAPDAHRRHRRRPAGGPVRPGVLRSRAWRRTPTAPAAFILMNTGDQAGASRRSGLLTTVAWKLGNRRVALRARGQRLHRRRGGAVAARRAGHHQERGGGRSARARGAGHDGVYCRAGVRGSRRAVLGPHAHAARFSASRAAPTPRTSRAPRWRRSRYQTHDILQAMEADSGTRLSDCAWTAARRPTTCSCSSRRTSSACPVVRPRVRRPPRSARRTWPGSRSVSGRRTMIVRKRRAIERRFDPQMDAATRARLYRGWQRAVERTMGWAKDDEA